MHWSYITLFVLLSGGLIFHQCTSQTNNRTPNGYLFQRAIYKEFGANDTISNSEVEKLLSRLRGSPEGHGSTPAVGNYTECDHITGGDADLCWTSKCLSADGALQFIKQPPDGQVHYTDFGQLCPLLLYQALREGCPEGDEEETVHPSKAEVWGFGFLAVTIINACAIFGVLFYPLMKTSFYTYFLMFMVALGVGTLTASALFVLIPECLGLTEGEHEFSAIYLDRMVIVLGGLYMFFLVERMLKAIRNKIKERKSSVTLVAMTVPPSDAKVYQVGAVHEMNGINSLSNDQIDLEVKKLGDDRLATPETSDGSVLEVRSVAWMVVFGDALHNFVDGLSIGAAFYKSPLFGVSVSLAIFCEELPHELGDFAILLNSGMTLRQALCCNFLSACTCYIGLVIGILVGELSEGSIWIFAIAAGMFLYIALVDMLPEINEEVERSESVNRSGVVVFLVQNAGFICGIVIIWLLAAYGGNIDLLKGAEE